MVVVTNGCQDKGENGTHFILVVFMSSSRFSGGKEDDRSKIDCHTQSCQFPADRFWNSSNHKVFEQKQQRKLSNGTSKLYIPSTIRKPKRILYFCCLFRQVDPGNFGFLKYI